MKTVGIFDAKTRLSELCREVAETGQEITITRRGQILARLLPPSTTPITPRVPGRLVGQFKVADEVFFSPLPETDLQLWETGEDSPTTPAKPSS